MNTIEKEFNNNNNNNNLFSNHLLSFLPNTSLSQLYFTIILVLVTVVLYLFNFKRPQSISTSNNKTGNTNKSMNNNTPDTSHLHMESGGLFTLKEYNILSILCETLISSDEITEAVLQDYSVKTTVNTEILQQYFKRSATDLDIASHFLKTISTTRTRAQISDLKTLLYLFSSPAGVILTGTLSSFTQLPLNRRQKIFASLKQSANPLRRQAFKAIAPLTFSLYLTVLSKESGINPNWEALKYRLPPLPEHLPVEENLSFIQINSERSLKADVVVIGSGAGGGVTAAMLAEAGYSVIVLEKGGYISPNAMTWKEYEAFPAMYEQAGTMTSDDLSISILAGSCVGGGTTVNWAASINTPDGVIEEWKQSCPNTYGDTYREAMEKVSQRLNVNTEESIHNVANGQLSVGLDTLSLENSVIPRNVKNCDTSQCGYCSMGCRTKSKQSSMVTYLEDACAKGAQIITNCFAEHITTTRVNGSPVVHGVVGNVVHQDGVRFRVFIKTNIVVAAAGALHTPALLMRSGLNNPNIGKTLYLHPVVPTVGLFDKDVEVWTGVPMSVVSKQYMGKNGTIIEVPNAHLGLSSSLGTFLWENSSSIKDEMLNLRKWSAFISILRDKNPGKVKLDKDYRSPRIEYTLSKDDWRNLLPGVEGALRAMVATGAKKVGIPIAGVPMCDSEEIEDYIKMIRNLKYKANLITIFSAHQMGSCRMGSSRNNSVAKETGESWDLQRLFIADGSVLPTAVGVNPMITIYATAYQIAKSIINQYPPSKPIQYENTTNNSNTTGGESREN